MHVLNLFFSALLATSGVDALRSAPKVKLSKIQSLTLRKDLKTSNRRVDAIPQVRSHAYCPALRTSVEHSLETVIDMCDS